MIKKKWEMRLMFSVTFDVCQLWTDGTNITGKMW